MLDSTFNYGATISFQMLAYPLFIIIFIFSHLITSEMIQNPLSRRINIKQQINWGKKAMKRQNTG
jgi:hypothetical protein